MNTTFLPANTMTVRRMEVAAAHGLAQALMITGDREIRLHFLLIADQLEASEGNLGEGVVNAYSANYMTALNAAIDGALLTSNKPTSLEHVGFNAIQNLLLASRDIALTCGALQSRSAKVAR